MQDKFKVTYTNKDIMDKLEKIHNQVEEVKRQAIKTNGCVAENKSNITFVKKLIYGAYGFTASVLAFLIGHLIQTVS